jgi:hypothetical protein
MRGAGTATGLYCANAGSIIAIVTPSTGTMMFSLVVIDAPHSIKRDRVSFVRLKSNVTNAGSQAHPPKFVDRVFPATIQKEVLSRARRSLGLTQAPLSLVYAFPSAANSRNSCSADGYGLRPLSCIALLPRAVFTATVVSFSITYDP